MRTHREHGGLPLIFGNAARALAPHPAARTASSWCSRSRAATTASTRWCPTRDDAYYRHRPTIGLKAGKLRKLDDHFGLQPRHGRLRAALQGRQARRGARLRLRRARRSRTSRRWPTGTPPRPTAARSTAGSADSPTRWTPAARPTSWSTSTSTQSLAVRSREPHAGGVRRSRQVRAQGFYQEKRGARAMARRRRGRQRPRARICSTSRAAPATPPPWCARHGAATSTPVDYGIIDLDLDEGRGADRRRHAHAPVLLRATGTTPSTPTCIRSTCTSAC